MSSIQDVKREVATLNSLADKIKDLANQMTKQLEAENIQPVTLEADSPVKYKRCPPGFFYTRQLLEDTMKDLWILSQGPLASVFNYVHMAIPDASCLNVLNHFDFWNAVPLNGEATFEDISRHTQLPLDVVSRIIDHAVTMRFFIKPSPIATSVRHTSRSAALVRDSRLMALVQMVLDETGPPMFVLPEALRRYSQGKAESTQDMNETAFKLCHSGGIWGDFKNSWDFIENDGLKEGDIGYEKMSKGWRQRNFVRFMSFIKDVFSTEDIMLNAIDWAGAGEVTVVDLGGSAGHDDQILARKFPNLKIIVQDLPEVAPVFEEEFPKDLRDRVSFRTHNFFEPQSVKANIYMVKWILHDWPDEECVKILRSLVPALQPGARIIFIDYVGKQAPSDEELPRSTQGFGTATDLRMMALFNGKERPVEAWQEIFKAADERYKVTRVDTNPLSFMCVLEAVWTA